MGQALEELRVKLYSLLNSSESSYEEILKVSQELDNEIVLYYNMYHLSN